MVHSIKKIILGTIIAICLASIYVFHHIYHIDVVFTHLFYIPILIAALWFRYASIYMALLLGGSLLLSQYFSNLPCPVEDVFRAAMFLIISTCITIVIALHRKNIIYFISQNNLNEAFNQLHAENEEFKILNQKLTTEKLQIEKHEQELKQTNATKDKLFSIIAHDLRTPFNAIIGFSNLIIEKAKQHDYNEIENYSQILNQASKQSFNLLNNLLYWSRLQMNNIEFNLESIDLKKVITSEIEILKGNIDAKNIDIQTDVNSSIAIFADMMMMQIIIRNLLSNAIKFTHNQGQIIIHATESENEVQIKISDNGIGMTESKMAQLFKIDQNISTEGTNSEKGSGLGLILCKEFVEKHNGTIHVNSQLNQGSTFTIIIPKK